MGTQTVQEGLALVKGPTFLTKPVGGVVSDLAIRYGGWPDLVHECTCWVQRVQHCKEVWLPFWAGYYNSSDKNRGIFNVSVQSGCVMQCNFCEIGPFRRGTNLTGPEIAAQITILSRLLGLKGRRLRNKKVNFAGSGDSLLNPHVVDGMRLIAQQFHFRFKISTVLPNTPQALEILREIAAFAAEYDLPVQLTISLITTNDEYRREVVGPLASTNEQIAAAVALWYQCNPRGRQPNLSCILTDKTPMDPCELAGLSTARFPVRLRLRPMMPTANSQNHGLTRVADADYNLLVRRFEAAGFKVSTAGRQTPTEVHFGVASNAQLEKHRLLLPRHTVLPG